MENKLISMTDFVLEVLNRDFPYNEVKILTQMSNYANFLKQPLKLEMFVPCDDEGNILEEPKNMADAILDGDSGKDWANKSVKYEEAKEKVLFEGFIPCITNNIQSVYHEKTTVFFELRDGKNIESISRSGKIQLTPTALKQIGL